MKEDPPADAKCRDKFLVQSVAISADKEVANVSQIVRYHCQLSKPSVILTFHCSGPRSSRMPSRRYKRRRSVLSSCLPRALLPPMVQVTTSTILRLSPRLLHKPRNDPLSLPHPGMIKTPGVLVMTLPTTPLARDQPCPLLPTRSQHLVTRSSSSWQRPKRPLPVSHNKYKTRFCARESQML